MDNDIWERHRTIWQNKPVLRAIYEEWYKEIARWMSPGLTVELGGGIGNLKRFAPQVISTDVVTLPWLDAVADGQAIPFKRGSLSNIVMVDVLHHVEQVRKLFDEAVRVLRPGGRIIILDPYMSWLSWPIYTFLHREPVDMRADPLTVQPSNPNRRPFDANQAVATILFDRAFPDFQRRYPGLTRIVQRRLACLAYPLSGGFGQPSLYPEWMLRPLLALDRSLERLSSLLAFRVLIVLQKEQ